MTKSIITVFIIIKFIPAVTLTLNYGLPVGPGWESFMCHIEGIVSRKHLGLRSSDPGETTL